MFLLCHKNESSLSSKLMFLALHQAPSAQATLVTSLTLSRPIMKGIQISLLSFIHLAELADLAYIWSCIGKSFRLQAAQQVCLSSDTALKFYSSCDTVLLKTFKQFFYEISDKSVLYKPVGMPLDSRLQTLDPILYKTYKGKYSIVTLVCQHVAFLS